MKIIIHYTLEKKLKELNKKPLKNIPWKILSPFDSIAIKYHKQSLERLNKRGGLSPMEVYSIVNDLPFSKIKKTDLECYLWLEEKVSEDSNN